MSAAACAWQTNPLACNLRKPGFNIRPLQGADKTLGATTSRRLEHERALAFAKLQVLRDSAVSERCVPSELPEAGPWRRGPPKWSGCSTSARHSFADSENCDNREEGITQAEAWSAEVAAHKQLFIIQTFLLGVGQMQRRGASTTTHPQAPLEGAQDDQREEDEERGQEG